MDIVVAGAPRSAGASAVTTARVNSSCTWNTSAFRLSNGSDVQSTFPSAVLVS
jgi:hypothetical protein